MSGNQLPVSASMWQRWSQICFATFTWQKILKFPNNSATTEATEKISIYLESLEL